MYYVAAQYLKLESCIHGFFWVHKKRNLGLKLEKFSLEILDFQAEWLEKRNWDLRNLWSVNKYEVSVFGISLKNYSSAYQPVLCSDGSPTRVAATAMADRCWTWREAFLFLFYYFYHDIWIIIHCDKIILFVIHFKITSSKNCFPWVGFLFSSHGKSTQKNDINRNDNMDCKLDFKKWHWIKFFIILYSGFYFLFRGLLLLLEGLRVDFIF